MVIITSVYGDRYLFYLGALLKSIYKVNDKIKTIVIYDDIQDVKKIIDFEKMYKDKVIFKYRGNHGDMHGQPRVFRVARKIRTWCDGIQLIHRGENIIFLDVDTFVLKDPFVVFADDFDIGFTIQKGRWKINSGVLFFKSIDESHRKFLSRWMINTEFILKDAKKIIESSTRFGAVDQASLVATINDYKNMMTIKDFPCDMWNMTRCTNNIEKVGIFHFKGCLPLLLKERKYGEEYGDERTPIKCEKAFELWREAHRESECQSNG